jgi:hypothetical protein
LADRLVHQAGFEPVDIAVCLFAYIAFNVHLPGVARARLQRKIELCAPAVQLRPAGVADRFRILANAKARSGGTASLGVFHAPGEDRMRQTIAQGSVRWLTLQAVMRMGVSLLAKCLLLEQAVAKDQAFGCLFCQHRFALKQAAAHGKDRFKKPNNGCVLNGRTHRRHLPDKA